MFNSMYCAHCARNGMLQPVGVSSDNYNQVEKNGKTVTICKTCGNVVTLNDLLWGHEIMVILWVANGLLNKENLKEGVRAYLDEIQK